MTPIFPTSEVAVGLAVSVVTGFQNAVQASVVHMTLPLASTSEAYSALASESTRTLPVPSIDLTETGVPLPEGVDECDELSLPPPPQAAGTRVADMAAAGTRSRLMMMISGGRLFVR
jgi:hypothetical protein